MGVWTRVQALEAGEAERHLILGNRSQVRGHRGMHDNLRDLRGASTLHFHVIASFIHHLRCFSSAYTMSCSIVSLSSGEAEEGWDGGGGLGRCTESPTGRMAARFHLILIITIFIIIIS